MGMCSVVVPGGAAMLERSLKGRQVLPAHDFISQCTASEDRRKEEGVVTGQYQYEYDVMKQVLDLPLICKLPTQEDMRLHATKSQQLAIYLQPSVRRLHDTRARLCTSVHLVSLAHVHLHACKLNIRT